VAIKVLPEEFANDTDRVARFQREAKLLASLNHPSALPFTDWKNPPERVSSFCNKVNVYQKAIFSDRIPL
jgi:serine/threonine protein kinase